jgi:hypothetical protein
MTAPQAAPATIFVRFTFGGWHCWPDAPERRAYLRDRHRHLFHVEVKTTVDHDDRELEFHDLLAFAAVEFSGLGEVDPEAGIVDFGSQSCETLARRLATVTADKYDKAIAVEVSEDGECGALVAEIPSRMR